MSHVLLTGATGFVGQYLYPALVAAGHRVRCATRRPEEARRAYPDRDWVEFDIARPDTVEQALEGCEVAFYLVHGMRQGGDYPEREASGARNFAQVARRQGVDRVVYLGGVLPKAGVESRHLASRRATGEILRSEGPPTVELRAAMIVGEGSAGWVMVRDLAARLPFMLLPRWLRNYSWPVAIDDVVWALIHAASSPDGTTRILDVPGPDRLTHREVLERVAAMRGPRRVMLNVPVLSPRLSSYWIALVTGIELQMAQELVEGVRHDLEPGSTLVWDEVTRSPLTLEEAARNALSDARPDRAGARVTRMAGLGAELQAQLARVSAHNAGEAAGRAV